MAPQGGKAGIWTGMDSATGTASQEEHMFRGILSVGLLVVFPIVASAQQPCTTDARRVVDELYRHMLERSADPGSQGWVDKLQSGTTVREIVRQIAQSPEHMQRFFNPNEGGAANERAVANLYRHILGRQPDAGGLRTYGNVASRSGFAAVVDSIVNSSEYTNSYGDWGVPGSGGVNYCGNAQSRRNEGNGQRTRFNGLDTNRDGVISLNEWRGSRNAFRNHDWNGDGVLSGDEIRDGAIPPASSIDARDYDMPMNDRFEYLDLNNNGFIDQNEWDGTLNAFYRLDRNNDGRLSRAELGGTSGSSTSFAALDLNRDGRIELDEWPWSHRTFDQQDTNGDGVITRYEFRAGAVPTTGR